jgi:integrase
LATAAQLYRRAQLSRALADAVADRTISIDPAAGLHRRPRVAGDADVVRRAAARLPGLAAGDLHAGLWRPAATTGLCRGELAGLRRRDLDFEHGRVVVAQQRTKGAARSRPDQSLGGRRVGVAGELLGVCSGTAASRDGGSAEGVAQRLRPRVG